MSGASVRAGGAFVEMYLKDEEVQASLTRLKTQLVAFGAAVDAVGTRSFATMNAAAVAGTASTTASVGILAATMGVLKATVDHLGVSFRVVFGILTTSVTRVVIGLGTLSLLVSRFAGKSSIFGRLLNGFLSRSQATEAIGRWTRLFGALSGSSALRGIGNRIERLGLGSAIVAGINRGGLAGGISASLGAAFRSSKSIVMSSMMSLLTSPLALLRGTSRTASAALSVVTPQLTTAAAASQTLAGGLTRAGVASRTLAASRAGVAAVAASIMSMAMRAGAFAMAISGPAVLAAKSFVTAAKTIADEAASTGVSVEALISKRFGTNSMISPADIKAGAELAAIMTELKQATAAAFAQLGAAALPVLKSSTETMLAMARAVTQILAKNRDLIATVVAVAARVAGAVGAILLMKAAFAAAVPVVALLMSPLGLIAAAIAGLIYFVPELRSAFVEAFGFLRDRFGELGQIFADTMKGISDALMGGNLKLAAQILWAGLRLAWLNGTQEIRDIWRTMVNNIASFGVDAFAAFETAITSVTSYMTEAFVSAFNAIARAWSYVQNGIAIGFAKIFARLTKQDEKQVLAELQQMQNQELQQTQTGIAEAAKAREQAAKARLKQIEEDRKATQDALADDLKAQQAAARQELKDAQDELARLKGLAAAGKPVPGAGSPRIASSEFAATLGTFSAASASRSGVAGLSPLQKAMDKTAEATAQTAENTKNGGLAFA